MAGIVVGSVAVSVVPSAEGFAPRLAAIVDSALKPVTDRITRQISGAISQGFTDGGRTAAAQGAKSGGAFADAFKARVTAALKSLPDAKITADSSDAERKIAEIRASLEELSSKTVGVDINEGEAVAQLDRLKESLDEIGSKSPSAQVRVDTAAASAHLAEFQAELNHVDGETATAHVNADTSQAESGISGLMALIAGLGPALIPIGAVAVGGLAGIGAAAASGAAGLGVLALGFSGVSSAVGLLGKQQTQAATDSASAARSAGSSAAAQANAAAQVVAATEALKNARANADNQAITSAEQVKNARISLADAEHSAALAAIQSAEQVRAAEYSLTQADLQEKDAEQALADARRQAARDLQTFANNAVDAKLSVQQAQLNLTTAEEQYQADLKNPKVTPEQLAQDALNVAKAKQALVEANQAAKIAEQDNTKAQKEGVDGSPGVKTAAEQLAAARHQQLVATQNLADAERQQAAQARTSAEQITKAEQGVSDAIRAQSVQQRQSAYSIQQAQAGVASAMRSVATASQSAGSAGSTAMAGINTQIARLSPAVLHFAQYVRSTLEPAFKRLQGVAAAGLLPGVEQMFKNLQPLIGPFTRFVGGLAHTMGDLAAQAGKALTAPFWQHFFNFVSNTAGPNLVIMAHTIGNLAKGFAGLTEAFNPVVQQIGQGFLHLTQRFADFGATAGKNSGFQAFLGYIKREGPVVADTFGKIATVVGKLLSALAPLGAVVLNLVDDLATFLATMSPTQLLLIAAAVGAIATAIVGPGVGLVVALVALAGVVVNAYQHMQAFRDFINNDLLPVFQGIWSFIQDKLAPVIKGILTDALNGAKSAFDHVRSAVEANKPQLQQLLHAFEDIVGFVTRDVLPLIGPTLKHYFELMGTQISIGIKAIGLLVRAFDDIVNAGKAVGRFITGPFVNFFVAGFHGAQRIVHDVVSAITSMWNGLKTVFEAPIKFVIDTVLDNGLIAAWNWIAGKVNGPTIKPFHPAGFATGGVIPGYAPGVDSVPAMLSPGEAVLRPEVARSIGAETINAWNAAAMSGAIPHFAEGGLVPTGGGWVGGTLNAAGSLAGVLKSFVGKIHSALNPLSSITDSVWGQLAAAVPQGLAKAMVAEAGRLAVKAANAVVPGGPHGGGNAGGPVPTGAHASMIRFGLQQRGLAADAANMSAMNIIISNESGWIPNNVNRWDSNWVAGHPSVGLMQVIRGTFDTYAGKYRNQGPFLYGVSIDPTANMYAGIGYAGGRYGGINNVPGVRAVRAGGKYVGYDMGGLIPPGPSLVYNGTGAPEVIAPQQTFNEYVNGLTGGSSGPAKFEGNLYLDDGTFLGVVRGEADNVVDGRVKRGKARARQGVRDPLDQLSR